MINVKIKPVLSALILLLPLFIFISCNQNASEKKDTAETPDVVEKKRSEVMAIHDEIMPHMGTLMNLKKQLRKRAAAMDSAQSIDKE